VENYTSKWEGLNHMSSPLTGQNARGQNGGKKGHNLATPVDLSMVPSLGTWAEKQRTPTKSSKTNHLSNHITTPERTRPVETEFEDRTVPSTDSEITEPNHEHLESDQESKNPFWSETDPSTELTDLSEINIEEHEETRKQFQSN